MYIIKEDTSPNLHLQYPVTLLILFIDALLTPPTILSANSLITNCSSHPSYVQNTSECHGSPIQPLYCPFSLLLSQHKNYQVLSILPLSHFVTSPLSSLFTLHISVTAALYLMSMSETCGRMGRTLLIFIHAFMSILILLPSPTFPNAPITCPPINSLFLAS